MTSPARPGAAVLAVMAAVSLVVLDAGMLNVGLPVIAASLHVAPGQAMLTVSAYQAALVIGLLPSAHVAEKLGSKQLFLTGLALFSAASIACGFAPSLGWLVFARIVQGLGGAAIMALGIALLRFALGSDRLGRAIGWNAQNVALCSAAAPIVGALILSAAAWPWLFFVKVPIIAIALAASPALPAVAPSRDRVDWVGVGLHASAAGALLIAAGMARTVWAICPGTLAIALAVALARRERAQEAPIWPVDLLGQPAFRASVAASITCFAAQSAGLLALPFYLQLGLGHGPVGAGLVMTCWPLTVAPTSLIASRLAERFGSARLCVAGGATLALGLLFSALWPVGESIAPLAAGAALSGLGFGLFQVPNNRTMFLAAPAQRSAAAGGMQGTARLIGQAIGAAVTGLLLAGATPSAAPRLGLAIGAAFAIVAALVSATQLRRAIVARSPREARNCPASFAIDPKMAMCD